MEYKYRRQASPSEIYSVIHKKHQDDTPLDANELFLRLDNKVINKVTKSPKKISIFLEEVEALLRSGFTETEVTRIDVECIGKDGCINRRKLNWILNEM